MMNSSISFLMSFFKSIERHLFHYLHVLFTMQRHHEMLVAQWIERRTSDSKAESSILSEHA